MSCRRHVAQLGQMYKDFKKHKTDVLVILGDTPERAVKYARALKSPFPVLADPDRAVYHEYDLEKAYILIQRTASVIVDRKGVIRYLERSTSSLRWHDESRALLDFVQSLSGKST